MALSVLPIANVSAQFLSHRCPDALAVESVTDLLLAVFLFSLDFLDQTRIAALSKEAQRVALAVSV